VTRGNESMGRFAMIRGMAWALVLAVCLAAPAAVPVVSAHPHDAPAPEHMKQIEQQVLAFREELKKAIEAKDVARLRSMYVDSFTHTHGSGKMDGKDARIVSLLSGDPVIETAPASELGFRAFGGDAVIVTGVSPILSKAEGRLYDFRWMAVYVKIGGHWHLAASQATRLPVLTN
jgi:ketosteroid isomerase-like protein